MEEKSLKKNKGGRPDEWQKTRTRQELLLECAELGLSLDQAASVAGIHKDTINRYLKRQHGVSYSQFRKQNTGRTAKMLINRALDHVINADDHKLKPAILIFLLKNYAGMMDTPLREEDPTKNTIILNYNLDKEPGEYRDVSKIQDNNKQD